MALSRKGKMVPGQGKSKGKPALTRKPKPMPQMPPQMPQPMMPGAGPAQLPGF